MALKQYLVLAEVHAPYPKNFTHKVNASAPGMAAHLAFKELRSGPLKGKRVPWIQFRVTDLSIKTP